MIRQTQRRFSFILLVWIALLLLSAGVSGVFAQGAPVQVEDALAAFNQQVGLNLTLNDFYWEWSQEEYPDTSLGCPQSGQSYAQVVTTAYQFLFTWNNEIYDYRVSADRSLVVFCGKTSVESGEDTGLDPELSNSLCPPPTEQLVYMRTRLAPGIQGRVTPPLPNNLRAEPASGATLLGEIPAGGVFDILTGPTCDAEGHLWWEVSYNGQQGWTAEGRDNEYWVEPLRPDALPAPTTVITPENVTSLSQIATLQGNYAEALAWSSRNILAATGAAGSEGVWLYDWANVTDPLRILPEDTPLNEVTFSAAADKTSLALFGDAGGGVRLWDTTPSAGTVERVFFNGHDDPVTAVAFSADGKFVASSGGYAYTDLPEDTNNFAIILWSVDAVAQTMALRGHTGDVLDLAFSPDGTRLASASADGSVRIWNLADGSEVNAITGDIPATSVTFSPDGTQLATGWDDGAVTISSVSTNFEITATLVNHVGGVTDVTYSPDGSLVASVGEDGALVVRDPASTDTTEVPPLEPTHNGIAYAVAFSPDGTLIATLGADNIIRLWSAVPSVG